VKSPFHFSRVVLASLSAVILTLSLNGCGQKGPLYIAKPPERIVRTAPVDDAGKTGSSTATTAATPAK
jgi:predicted small lipoprotein YifL